jgi:hypothetical protein
MRILLDECVHSKVGNHLPGHTVQTVPSAGLRGLRNGQLLARIGNAYDVFVTSDKNIEYQHNPSKLPLPIVILNTRGNMWEDIEPVLPQLRELLSVSLQAEFYTIEN